MGGRERRAEQGEAAVVHSIDRVKRAVHASEVQNGERLECGGSKSVDQVDIEGPGESRRSRDVELIVLAAGRGAADFQVQSAGRALRIVAADRQHPGQVAGTDCSIIDDVRRQRACTDKRPPASLVNVLLATSEPSTTVLPSFV